MKIKNTVLKLTLLAIIIMSIAGCGNSGSAEQSSLTFLKNDAFTGLKSTYARDYSQFTIIRGALYKFIIDPQNPQHLGVAIGAAESAIFPDEYELNRFDRLENMTAEMRKEIISQPMLAITLKKREVLNHIYSAILKPLAANIENSKQATSQETVVINNLITLLDNLAEDYSVLSKTDSDFYTADAQNAFISIQDTFRQLQNLELDKEKVSP